MFSPPYFQSRGITKHAMTLTYAAAFLSDGKWGRYFFLPSIKALLVVIHKSVLWKNKELICH